MTLRSLLAGSICIALCMGSLAALAEPGNGKNKDKGNPQNGHVNTHGNDHENSHDKGNSHDRGGANQRDGNFDIDRSYVLGALGSYREYWSPGPALPPGIQKNLARGKPLPPGIARKLDSRLLGRLPRYEGYEWQQAGTDLILVAIATGIIYEVLDHAFD